MSDTVIKHEKPQEIVKAEPTIPVTLEPRALTAQQVVAQVRLIQEVMLSVMKKDTHYGVIPGCKQPSLYKAGSEVLLTTFRISVNPEVEDISSLDEIRYRVKAVGRHQTSGIVVGIGIGEASSSEDKYRWRSAVCQEEFDETPEDRRRMKYGRKRDGGHYIQQQVRTNPSDLANTVLKMAKKRAQIDLTLTATAASDIFTQDIEDLPDEYVQEQAAPPSSVSEESKNKVHNDTLFAIENNDAELLKKTWEGYDVDQQAELWRMFNSAQRSRIKKILGKE